MPFSIETAFNSSGAKPSSLKELFLSQRKWILLCAATIFLISNDYVSIDQEWLLFEFNINSWSKSFLKAVALSGVFFSIYMWLSAYAFLKKHRTENRKMFDELEIEERDTTENRIVELNSEKSKIDSEIRVRQQNLEKLENLSLTDENAVKKLKQLRQNLPLGARATITPELRQQVLSADKGNDSILIFSDTWSDEEVIEAIKILTDRRKTRRQQIERDSKAASALEDRAKAIEVAIVSATEAQTSLLKLNDREWRKFYKRRATADFISLVPSILGSFYCAQFLARDFFW